MLLALTIYALVILLNLVLPQANVPMGLMVIPPLQLHTLVLTLIIMMVASGNCTFYVHCLLNAHSTPHCSPPFLASVGASHTAATLHGLNRPCPLTKTDLPPDIVAASSSLTDKGNFDLLY